MSCKLPHYSFHSVNWVFSVIFHLDRVVGATNWPVHETCRPVCRNAHATEGLFYQDGAVYYVHLQLSSRYVLTRSLILETSHEDVCHRYQTDAGLGFCSAIHGKVETKVLARY
jgi:hypothetical protein